MKINSVLTKTDFLQVHPIQNRPKDWHIKHFKDTWKRTWRKQFGEAGADDVSFRYSSQLKASKGQSWKSKFPDCTATVKDNLLPDRLTRQDKWLRWISLLYITGYLNLEVRAKALVPYPAHFWFTISKAKIFLRHTASCLVLKQCWLHLQDSLTECLWAFYNVNANWVTVSDSQSKYNDKHHIKSSLFVVAGFVPVSWTVLPGFSFFPSFWSKKNIDNNENPASKHYI